MSEKDPDKDEEKPTKGDRKPVDTSKWTFRGNSSVWYWGPPNEDEK